MSSVLGKNVEKIFLIYAACYMYIVSVRRILFLNKYTSLVIKFQLQLWEYGRESDLLMWSEVHCCRSSFAAVPFFPIFRAYVWQAFKLMVEHLLRTLVRCLSKLRTFGLHRPAQRREPGKLQCIIGGSDGCMGKKRFCQKVFYNHYIEDSGFICEGWKLKLPGALSF